MDDEEIEGCGAGDIYSDGHADEQMEDDDAELATLSPKGSEEEEDQEDEKEAAFKALDAAAKLNPATAIQRVAISKYVSVDPNDKIRECYKPFVRPTGAPERPPGAPKVTLGVRRRPPGDMSSLLRPMSKSDTTPPDLAAFDPALLSSLADSAPDAAGLAFMWQGVHGLRSTYGQAQEGAGGTGAGAGAGQAQAGTEGSASPSHGAAASAPQGPPLKRVGIPIGDPRASHEEWLERLREAPAAAEDVEDVAKRSKPLPVPATGAAPSLATAAPGTGAAPSLAAAAPGSAPVPRPGNDPIAGSPCTVEWESCKINAAFNAGMRGSSNLAAPLCAEAPASVPDPLMFEAVSAALQQPTTARNVKAQQALLGAHGAAGAYMAPQQCEALERGAVSIIGVHGFPVCRPGADGKYQRLQARRGDRLASSMSPACMAAGALDGWEYNGSSTGQRELHPGIVHVDACLSPHIWNAMDDPPTAASIEVEATANGALIAQAAKLLLVFGSLGKRALVAGAKSAGGTVDLNYHEQVGWPAKTVFKITWPDGGHTLALCMRHCQQLLVTVTHSVCALEAAETVDRVIAVVRRAWAPTASAWGGHMWRWVRYCEERCGHSGKDSFQSVLSTLTSCRATELRDQKATAFSAIPGPAQVYLENLGYTAADFDGASYEDSAVGVRLLVWQTNGRATRAERIQAGTFEVQWSADGRKRTLNAVSKAASDRREKAGWNRLESPAEALQQLALGRQVVQCERGHLRWRLPSAQDQPKCGADVGEIKRKGATRLNQVVCTFKTWYPADATVLQAAAAAASKP